MRELKTVKTEINAFLAEYLQERTERARKLSPRYGELWQRLSDVVLHGGKRIRPFLLLSSYEMYGKKTNESILHAAAAMELLHQGLLMHDDIIDRDYKRYGRLNVAGSFMDEYDSRGKMSKTDSLHLASGASLLAGDLAIAAAYDLIRKSGLQPEKIISLQQLVDDAIFEVVGGELLDSESNFSAISEIHVTRPLDIARLKTSSYSFILPLTSGAVLADANEKDISILHSYGEHCGIAFQLADDYLGVFGDESMTGKSATSDFEECKHTFMMQFAWKHADPGQKLILKKLLGSKQITEQDADTVRGILIATGAKSENENQMRMYAEAAQKAVEKLNSRAGRELLHGFAMKSISREH